MMYSMRKQFIGSSFSTPQTSVSSCDSIILQSPLILLSELQFSKVQIGKDGSAIGYFGYFRKTEVTAKVYDVDNPQLPIYKRMLAKEAAQLILLEHPNAVKCLRVCYEKSCLVLAIAKRKLTVEDVSYTVHPLRQLINVLTPTLFMLELKYDVIFQITSGLQYLHSQKVYYSDLKSANVLDHDQSCYNSDWTFWLCDVGEAHMEMNTKITSSLRTTKREGAKQGTISLASVFGKKLEKTGKKYRSIVIYG